MASDNPVSERPGESAADTTAHRLISDSHAWYPSTSLIMGLPAAELGATALVGAAGGAVLAHTINTVVSDIARTFISPSRMGANAAFEVVGVRGAALGGAAVLTSEVGLPIAALTATGLMILKMGASYTPEEADLALRSIN